MTVLSKAVGAVGNPHPRVINIDKNPAYSAAVEQLKAEGTLRRSVHLRQCTVKQRAWLAKGYGSFQSAWRTLQGIEAVNMIRKGRVRWLAKGDAVGQAHLIAQLFEIALSSDSRLIDFSPTHSLTLKTSQHNRRFCSPRPDKSVSVCRSPGLEPEPACEP